MIVASVGAVSLSAKVTHTQNGALPLILHQCTAEMLGLLLMTPISNAVIGLLVNLGAMVIAPLTPKAANNTAEIILKLCTVSLSAQPTSLDS